MKRSLLTLVGSDLEEKNRLLAEFFQNKKPKAYGFQDFVECLNELSGFSLFKSQRALYLEDIDKLSKMQSDALLAACKQLPSDISLCLQASSSKGVMTAELEKLGPVVKFAEKKPWEKMDRLVQEVIEKARQAQITFHPQAARAFIEAVGTQAPIVQTELDKLICYVMDSKEIQVEHVNKICTGMSHESIFELFEAICFKQTRQALEVLQALYQEGSNPLALLAALRSQVTLHLKMLLLMETQPDQLTISFPYLKGKMLEKKRGMLRGMGEGGLKRFQDLLFDAECDLKNHPLYPLYPLERIISQVV
jgi:DNA polymerase III delta subunit